MVFLRSGLKNRSTVIARSGATTCRFTASRCTGSLWDFGEKRLAMTLYSKDPTTRFSSSLAGGADAADERICCEFFLLPSVQKCTKADLEK